MEVATDAAYRRFTSYKNPDKRSTPAETRAALIKSVSETEPMDPVQHKWMTTALELAEGNMRYAKWAGVVSDAMLMALQERSK